MSTLYVGGYFTIIGGQQRNSLAALDKTTANATAWDPNPNFSLGGAVVHALAISGSTVFVGGEMDMMNGVNRNHLAAIDLTTGKATSWDPNALDGAVNALVLSGSTLYAGGVFTVIGGQAHSRVAALDATTGAPLAWTPDGCNLPV
ncbi:MAG: pyrroloquinoline quinone biosynthesis protein, partial [Candidatus Eisenbacteria bacterium]